MYAESPDGDSASAQTAFRASEKKYQLKLVEQFRTSANGRRRGGRFTAVPVDLSDALDVSASACARGARLVRTDGEMKVYAFDEHPGFYYMSNALSSEEQRVWVRAAAMELCAALSTGPTLSHES